MLLSNVKILVNYKNPAKVSSILFSANMKPYSLYVFWQIHVLLFQSNVGHPRNGLPPIRL